MTYYTILKTLALVALLANCGAREPAPVPNNVNTDFLINPSPDIATRTERSDSQLAALRIFVQTEGASAVDSDFFPPNIELERASIFKDKLFPETPLTFELVLRNKTSEPQTVRIYSRVDKIGGAFEDDHADDLKLVPGETYNGTWHGAKPLVEGSKRVTIAYASVMPDGRLVPIDIYTGLDPVQIRIQEDRRTAMFSTTATTPHIISETQ